MNAMSKLGFLTLAIASAATAWAQSTRLASAAAGGVEGNDQAQCEGVVISSDGRFVAFTSAATNLVAGDVNGHLDVFVRDRQTGTTELVSVSTGGIQGNGDSRLPSISSDGRYVAFESDATNLIAGDTNGAADIFLRDRQAGTTERVSIAALDAQGNGDSYFPSISADGLTIAFMSTSNNLVSGDTNGHTDIFVRDRQVGTTYRVSLTQTLTEANDESWQPSISGDGRFVAYESYATNLVAGDTNGKPDIFVYDRQSLSTERVSVSSTGTQSNGYSRNPAISSDGRCVAFESNASNLVSGDTNTDYDVFVFDRQTFITQRVSVSTSGAQGNGFAPSLSADGRYVAFTSSTGTLVGGDTNGEIDVFVRDRTAGTTVRASLAFDGSQGDFSSGTTGVGVPFGNSISGDGHSVAFFSFADNLIDGGDTNGIPDIFVRNLMYGTTQRVSISSGGEGNSTSDQPSISSDGKHVSFRSDATSLVPNDTNAWSDVFAFDSASGTVERVSVGAGGAQANGPSFGSSISSDGRYVAFESEATNMVASDANGNDKDVFVRDRQSGTTSIVSVSSGGVQGDDQSRAPTITPDGRYVAFWSFATTLVAGDTNGHGDIFVRDLQSHTTDIASVATGGVQENGSALYPAAISADGRFVAFLSTATNLVAGDTNGSTDVFVHDRQTGTTERVSVDSSGVQGNSDCYAPLAISADGRYVAFSSDATNLVAGDTNNSTDVFLRDRQAGTTERVTLGAGGVQADAGGYSPAISAYGRFVAFASDSTNLVAADSNGATDVFLRDRLTGKTERVSLANDGSQSNGGTYAPSISSDGRVVAFEGGATNLVLGDVNGVGDVFLRDRGAAASFAAFCAGDGVLAPCPCGNSGAPGHGCENSSTTGGAVLTASGVASLASDSARLTAADEKPTATSVLLQGTLGIAPAHYGDGLRCAGGSLKRLYTHNAFNGFVVVPQGTDLPISAASAAKGDVIAAGATRVYQIYYRDPSTTFCPSPSGGGFNISNAIAVLWGP